MLLSLAQQKSIWKYLALHKGEHMLKSEHCSSNNEITATEEAFSGFSIVQTKSGATAAAWCLCCSSRSWGCCNPACLPPSALAQRSQGHWHLTPSAVSPKEEARLQLGSPPVRDQRHSGSAEELPLAGWHYPMADTHLSQVQMDWWGGEGLSPYV